jgi:hypothetical protein
MFGGAKWSRRFRRKDDPMASWPYFDPISSTDPQRYPRDAQRWTVTISGSPQSMAIAMPPANGRISGAHPINGPFNVASTLMVVDGGGAPYAAYWVCDDLVFG